MQISKTNSITLGGSVKAMKNLRVLVLCAIFVAMSIVLGKFLSFTAGPFRFSFENLSIIMSGVMFGPFAGLMVGLCADIVGCIAYGYTICPLITLGACCVGFFSGLSSTLLFKNNKIMNVAFATAFAHIIGSMAVKSYALHTLYGTPMKTLLLRIPLYIVIGLFEGTIIYFVTTNKALSSQLDRIYKKL